jgi:hypothetical protein
VGDPRDIIGTLRMHKTNADIKKQTESKHDPTDRARQFFADLGPGLITGAADDDPSGISTYSVTGASFGYMPLWTALFSFPLMAAVQLMCDIINPKLRGWANYFRVGQGSRCFSYIKDWAENKVRRHLMRARNWRGFDWNRWSREWLYKSLGLYNDYKVRYYRPESADGP